MVDANLRRYKAIVFAMMFKGPSLTLCLLEKVQLSIQFVPPSPSTPQHGETLTELAPVGMAQDDGGYGHHI